MNLTVVYSEYKKDKLIQRLKRLGRSVVVVEKDFVGVWTIGWRY